ncbi:MAG: LicD family protein [Muribaculaceae bacterium]|nr:LicD family protein [Muribaculaceae bacterium]
MTTYDIRPLQLKILETLKALDEVCHKHGLRYYITAGTMLGAVRHKGFIPWDDDLDIAMPRPDYDRLIEHCSDWLPDGLEMICAENDQDYPFPFAKIQNARTTLIERKHIRYLGGVYIDVFPLDGVPAGKFGRMWHFMRYAYLKRIVYFVYRDPFKHGHGMSSWIPRLVQKLYSRKSIQHKLKRIMTSCPYDTSVLVVDHDDGAKGVLPKHIIGDPTPVDFEGCKMMGYAKAHEYLANKYGDYMTVPDQAHQRQHNFYYMDLNSPYRDYADRHLLEM